jgi:hypothetical protein
LKFIILTTIAAAAYSILIYFCVLGLTLATASLSLLVIASDFLGADINSLTTEFQDHSELDLPGNQRWYYCCGLGMSLATMGEYFEVSLTERLT